MNPTPIIKREISLILCDHVCITTLYVLSFLIPHLYFALALQKPEKTLSPTLFAGNKNEVAFWKGFILFSLRQ